MIWKVFDKVIPTHVWCFNPNNWAQQPPTSGWKVPWNEGIDGYTRCDHVDDPVTFRHKTGNELKSASA